jgi:hypothetical protein
MGGRRVLASIVESDASLLVVRVYEQDGDEVERIDWQSGLFDEERVQDLLCLSISNCVPRRRADRTMGRGPRRARSILGGEQRLRKRDRAP